MPALQLEDQRAVFAFLQAPETHGLKDPVTRIDTHGAVVFLAGPDVYKVKRAIRVPFLDFSTLEKRHAACEAEIAVNKANAPALYLGTLPIVRAEGRLRLGGAGEVIDWAVHLRRFDETATLDHVAAKGPLGPALIDALARAVADSHRRAPEADGESATDALHRVLEATVDELREVADLLPGAGCETFASRASAAFARAEPLLRQRGAEGRVRHCHGDLHLGNIVLIDGTPVLFDAIEFDESIATTDILYDLAFLIMDLWKRGLKADANRLLNRYLLEAEDRESEIEGLAALPLLLGLRAAVRAKVIATQAQLDGAEPGLAAEARSYLDAAVTVLAPPPPRLVAVGGLSGSGKTSLAAAIAPMIGPAPGALHLRSDIERKRLFGAAETTPLPDEAYRPEATARVYGLLGQLTARALDAGHAVILDATHRHEAEREATAALAGARHLPFCGLWLEAPLALLQKRVAARHNDASDATATVVAAQAEAPSGEVAWRRIDASRPLEEMRAEALAAIAAARDPGTPPPLTSVNAGVKG